MHSSKKKYIDNGVRSCAQRHHRHRDTPTKLVRSRGTIRRNSIIGRVHMRDDSHWPVLRKKRPKLNFWEVAKNTNWYAFLVVKWCKSVKPYKKTTCGDDKTTYFMSKHHVFSFGLKWHFSCPWYKLLEKILQDAQSRSGCFMFKRHVLGHVLRFRIPIFQISNFKMFEPL